MMDRREKTTPDAGELLRERRLRVTPQRRAILGAFRDRADEHLSADEVHSRASQVVPEIGRGTVYATLAELTELGLLSAVGSPEPVRYEVNVAPHDHFRCRQCLRLFDVDLPHAAAPVLPAGFVVERVSTTAEGICAACGAYRRGVAAGAGAVTTDRQIAADLVGTLACARHDGPLGEIVLAATPDGLARIAFPEHADYPALLARHRSRRGSRAARGHAEDAAERLDEYFGGSTVACESQIDWLGAERATSGALEATCAIPYGDARSYHVLAAELDAYACGYSLGTNPVPLVLPCHRVSCGSERLEMWVGGSERLGRLHQFESDTLAGAPAQ